MSVIHHRQDPLDSSNYLHCRVVSRNRIKYVKFATAPCIKRLYHLISCALLCEGWVEHANCTVRDADPSHATTQIARGRPRYNDPLLQVSCSLQVNKCLCWLLKFCVQSHTFYDVHGVLDVSFANLLNRNGNRQSDSCRVPLSIEQKSC
jgi:hypothetical protein